MELNQDQKLKINNCFKKAMNRELSDAEILEIHTSLVFLAKARVRYEQLKNDAVLAPAKQQGLVTPVIRCKVATSRHKSKNSISSKWTRVSTSTTPTPVGTESVKGGRPSGR